MLTGASDETKLSQVMRLPRTSLGPDGWARLEPGPSQPGSRETCREAQDLSKMRRNRFQKSIKKDPKRAKNGSFCFFKGSSVLEDALARAVAVAPGTDEAGRGKV